MKKTLFAVWIFSAVFFVLSASESKPEFSVKIFLTKAVNLEDQFAGILPERPPHFSVISRVSCGEPFEVGIVFVGAAIRDGSVRLEGKIVMTDPKGEKKELPLIGSIAKVSGDTSGVFLFPQRLQVIYEPDDPKGTFTFDVELTDCHAHKTASASASLVYGEAPEPKSGEKAFDRLSRYYREPAPEYIIPAFREFLANLPKQKEKEKNSFNPLPQLAFFYFLLRENPPCVPSFAELLKSLHGEEKYMAAVVLNFVSEESAKSLTADQRKAVGQQFPANPFSFEDALLPWQLDICWAEFLVRGTKAPVMKVVRALSLAGDSVTIDEFKKIEHPSSEDQRKLMNGLTAMAASWSLSSLMKENPLIRYYVEAALVRGEVKDPFAAALAARALGMKVTPGPGPKDNTTK